MEDDDIEEVQLDLEVEEPPAPQPKPELDAAEESDPATEAFARLEGEMAMVRHTVQNMARERADVVIPDYTATLGQMADQLAQVSKTLSTIGNKPAIELTPEDIAVQIERASLDMLRDSSGLFRQGRKDLDTATGRLAAIVGRVRAEDEQKRETWRFAGLGVLAGVLLWSILPGTIARAMPESWQWPERMARKAVGEPSIVEAGIRLIRSQNPEAWEELAAAQRVLSTNRDAWERCVDRSRKEETTGQMFSSDQTVKSHQNCC